MKTTAEPVYIIAEAGVNHNGSLDLARKLVDTAVYAGADAVKFQTFKAESLVSAKAPKAVYQQITTGPEESQLEMLKKLELDETAHAVLIQYCRDRKIQFLSSPFDMKSLDLLVRTFHLPRIKISSGDITNGPLLLKAARHGRPIILSTGMSDLDEVETALGVLAFGYTQPEKAPSLHSFREAYRSDMGGRILRDKVVLLHCTTQYPAPIEDVNLRAMVTMRKIFGIPVGYSDHTPGFSVSIAAVSMGAVIIEKHFTLDRSLPGPDHRASLEPEELKGMIDSIRQTEQAMGSPIKAPAPSETGNKAVARKSIVAACDIQAGERFSENNITIKRPGTGASPMQYWKLLGQKSQKHYRQDDVIS